MPNMANITVKKADGTTDVVYTALSPSAGDRTPARWRVDAMSSIPAHRATAKLTTLSNGPQTARRFEFATSYPVVASVGGVDTVIGTIPLLSSGTLPQNLDAALVKEAIYQHGNLLVATLVRQSLESGFAPT